MRRRLEHMVIQGVDHKFCKSCKEGEGQWVPVTDFNKKSASYDSLETKCVLCARNKSAKFRSENPSFDREYQTKNADRLKAYKRDYYMKKKQEL